MNNRRKTDPKTVILDRAPVIPTEIKDAVGRCFGIMGTLDPVDKDKAVAEFEEKVKQDDVLNKRGGENGNS